MYSEEELLLLAEWRDKCAGWRWLHYEAMLTYKSLNSRYVYASILLSTVAGAGSFTSGGSGTDGVLPGKSMPFIIGGINVIISLLNSFQRFTKAAEKTELHASAAMQYAMIYRFIDTELQLSLKHQRKDLIQYVRHEFDRLLSQSPIIPQHIVKKYNKQFPHVEHKPDVCTGIATPPQIPSTPFFRGVDKDSLPFGKSPEVYNQKRSQSLQIVDSCTPPDSEAQLQVDDEESRSETSRQEPHKTS